MAFSLNGRMVVKQLLADASYSTASLATSGGQAWDGYNRAFIICSAGVNTVGDSDDTMAWQVSYSTVADAASDYIDLGNGADTTGAPATSDAGLGDVYFDLDLVELKLGSSGWLRVVGTPAEGLTVPASAHIIFYRATGKIYDSDFDALVTIVKST